jgi:hypothetical protein
MAKPSIVGDIINFRGLVYGPVNEMGVVALFAKVCEELGFIIEDIRAAHHLIVEFEGIGRVTTDISGRHKTFRTAHAEVKELFRSRGLRPGDKIEIVRLGKYEYKVRPASLGSEGAVS